MNKFKYFLFINMILFSSFTHSIQNIFVKEAPSRIEVLKTTSKNVLEASRNKCKKVWKWIKNNPKKSIAMASVATCYAIGYREIRNCGGTRLNAFKHAPIFGLREIIFRPIFFVKDPIIKGLSKVIKGPSEDNRDRRAFCDNINGHVQDLYLTFVKLDPFLKIHQKKSTVANLAAEKQEYFLAATQFRPNANGENKTGRLIDNGQRKIIRMNEAGEKLSTLRTARFDVNGNHILISEPNRRIVVDGNHNSIETIIDERGNRLVNFINRHGEKVENFQLDESFWWWSRDKRLVT